jgi:hypothetical protein
LGTPQLHEGDSESNGYFDDLLVGAEGGVLVDKNLEAMAGVCSENNYPDVSGFGVFALGGRPSLAVTPSEEIRFGPVETPSLHRQRR